MGSLCVLAQQPRFWSTKEIAILRDLAGVVMAEIASRAELVPSDNVDEQLVRLMARHDDVAEAVLYERYSASVYGLALQVVRSAGPAEELLQVAFWKLWEQAHRYEPGRVRFATWLLCITRNLAISERRSAARRPPLLHRLRRFVSTERGVDLNEAELGGTLSRASGAAQAVGGLVQTEPPAEETVWLAEQHRAIVDGLQALPLEQRQAVELAYFGGYSHSEIAAAQSAPVSTIKTRLSLGLRKLAAHLSEQGITREDALA